MKVLALAGGYGTRLYPLITDTPKALLDIQGQPLLNHTLKRLRDLDSLNEVLVVSNNKFYGHFCQWAEQLDYPHPVTIVNDQTNTPEERLGSIGDIRYALEDKNVDDDVLIVGGDNLFDYNVDEYLAFAKKKNTVTIGLYDIHSLEEAKQFGVVAIGKDRKVISFEEKPAEPQSTLIAMCFYYLPRQTLKMVSRYIDETGQSDKAGNYIKWLVGQTDVYGFEFSGAWYDIGSLEAYHDAQKNFKS